MTNIWILKRKRHHIVKLISKHRDKNNRKFMDALHTSRDHLSDQIRKLRQKKTKKK